jgi:transposase
LQQVRLDFLEEQFRLAKHKLFASQNEAHPGQGDLFNEVEEIAELEQAQADNEEVPHKRKRSVNAILSPSLSILSVK